MSAVDDAPSAAPAPGWKALLGEIGLTRQRLDSAAPVLYPLTIPHVGATPEQLTEAEARLGHPLDPGHRDLLTYANGWVQMFVHTDLLSAEQLGATGLWTRTRDLLAVLEEDWPAGYMPASGDLEIIGASEQTSDLFLIWRSGPVTDGGHPVLWVGSGQIVEQWDNVARFMRSVLSCTLDTLDDAHARRPPFDRFAQRLLRSGGVGQVGLEPTTDGL